MPPVGRGTRSVSADRPDPSAASSSTRTSTPASLRSTARSITSAPRPASTRPSRAANAARPTEGALGRLAIPSAAARRGPVNGAAATAATAPAAMARRAYRSTGPSGNGAGRSTVTGSAPASSGPRIRSASAAHHALSCARTSRHCCTRCATSRRVPSPRDASPCTSAATTDLAVSARSRPWKRFATTSRSAGCSSIADVSAVSSAGSGAHGATLVTAASARPAASAASADSSLVPFSPSAGWCSSSSTSRSSPVAGPASARRTSATSSAVAGGGSSTATTTRAEGALTRAQRTPGCASSTRSTRRATRCPRGPCTPCASMCSRPGQDHTCRRSRRVTCSTGASAHPSRPLVTRAGSMPRSSTVPVFPP
ncbi:hypothetical protein [Saccharothrix longispora]|uniref:hypothetical protein n=1 Tax=Saccharothrix longispora TaxID=33920 RepID=UPI0031EA7CD5